MKKPAEAEKYRLEKIAEAQAKKARGKRVFITQDKRFRMNMNFGASKFLTNHMTIRVAEIVRRHEGPSPKSLDSDKNVKPSRY